MPAGRSDHLTRSQIRPAAGGAFAFIGGLTAAATPFVPFIPEKQKGTVVLVLGVLSAVGAGLAAFNQSLSPNHVSIPVGEAKSLGAAGNQTKGK